MRRDGGNSGGDAKTDVAEPGQFIHNASENVAHTFFLSFLGLSEVFVDYLSLYCHYIT